MKDQNIEYVVVDDHDEYNCPYYCGGGSFTNDVQRAMFFDNYSLAVKLVEMYDHHIKRKRTLRIEKVSTIIRKLKLKKIENVPKM